MICSVCRAPFRPVDYCAQSTPTVDSLLNFPDLPTITLLCATCYERIKHTLLLEKEHNEHSLAVVEKQISHRRRATPLGSGEEASASGSKRVEAIRQEIEDEEQKIRELEEQLRLHTVSEYVPPPKNTPNKCASCSDQDVQSRGIRTLFTFNEAAAAINGFSLLQMEPAQMGKINDELQINELFSSTMVPILQTCDSINAGLAELSLCIQMMYQAMFREVYNLALARHGAFGQKGPKLAEPVLHSVLVAALPAPLVIFYHDGISLSILQPILQQEADASVKQIKKASRTVCELVWERPNTNTKLFTGAEKEAFALGMSALLGFVTDMYIFSGMESPCAVIISRQLLNMYGNSQRVVECYTPDAGDEASEYVSRKEPLLINRLYVSSTDFNEQTLAKLNITLVTSTDKRVASIDGVAPVHPSVSVEQWNSYVCKFIVMCSYLQNHVLNLLHK